MDMDRIDRRNKGIKDFHAAILDYICTMVMDGGYSADAAVETLIPTAVEDVKRAYDKVTDDEEVRLYGLYRPELTG